jgi:hypothetical protein
VEWVGGAVRGWNGIGHGVGQPCRSTRIGRPRYVIHRGIPCTCCAFPIENRILTKSHNSSPPKASSPKSTPQSQSLIHNPMLDIPNSGFIRALSEGTSLTATISPDAFLTFRACFKKYQKRDLATWVLGAKMRMR